MPDLPKPTLFWLENVVGLPNGLYASRNAVTMPEIQKGDSWIWSHYYTHFMADARLPYYWTALSPRRQVFDGFLSPLNDIVVEHDVVNGSSLFFMKESLRREWHKIEGILNRLEAVVGAAVLIPLEMQPIPSPSARFPYNRRYQTRSQAVSQFKTSRALFGLKITLLTFYNAMWRVNSWN